MHIVSYIGILREDASSNLIRPIQIALERAAKYAIWCYYWIII